MTASPPFPTLPLSWYFDPRVLEIERKTLLARGPDYIGCLPMVPRPGSFQTIAHRDEAEVLVRDGAEVRLLSNVCLHRNHLLASGRGSARALVCPMHRWSYDLGGKLIKAPLYPETPCLRLPSRPLQDWNGILFAGPRDVACDLAGLTDRPELDIRNYVFNEIKIEEQPVNWKIPIEIALENYHAPFTHPGLSRFTAAAAWYDGEGAFDDERVSYHEIKPHPDFGSNPGSPAFERLQRAILKIRDGQPPDFAALIMVYYPDIIFDWYPYMFAVTTCVPLTPERTLTTREIYIDPRAVAVVPDYPELVKAAWYEVQRADDEAHVSQQRGRAARYHVDPGGLAGYEIYQSMEDCVWIFHQLMMREVAPRLAECAAPAPSVATVAERIDA
jgi:phenylpropionate dioxygenase-like ring-hydroxylating dioxygenase large terminal subunit